MIDFLIIGGTKCGSTSLADYVAKSNRVNFCNEKEPAILNRRDLTESDIDFYKSLFIEKSGIKGEATPAYSDYGQVRTVIKNLKIINARPKIILIARNQIKRIQSGYIQTIKAFKVDPRHYSEIPLHERPGILNRGMFGHVIKEYINEFSKDSVLVLNFDLLIQKDSPELKRLKDFLGLEPELPNTLPRSNPSIGGRKKSKLAIIYKKYLYDFWKRNKLPSLRLFANILSKFSRKVKESEQLFLNAKQITYLKEHYKKDNELFQQFTGWSYWDISR
jgi:hypothetical protein